MSKPVAYEPSSLQPFTIEGVEFRCFVRKSDRTYVWSNAGGSLRIGRTGRFVWATVDGVEIGSSFERLIDGMRAAVLASKRRKAA